MQNLHRVYRALLLEMNCEYLRKSLIYCAVDIQQVTN